MVKVDAVFAGCNRSLDIFEYSYNTKQLAYASNNNLFISIPLIKENKFNFSNFKQSVKFDSDITCIKWDKESRIISGCQNGDICIYDCLNDKIIEILKPLSGHSISCLEINNNLLVIGNTIGDLFIYELVNLKYELKLSFKLPYGFYGMNIKIVNSSINDKDSEYILFVGGSKPVINVLSLINFKEIKIVNELPGHEDWVRSIDIRQIEDSENEVDNKKFKVKNYLIATSSLDRIIRLWKLSIEDINNPIFIETNKLKLLTSKEYKFNLLNSRCLIKIDAILMGHDDWISKISWKKDVNKETELMLLSSSADSSIMIWESDLISGVWFPKFRLGEIAIKGASTATGSSGGFYCSEWIIDEGIEIILTNGKTGSIRCWIKEKDDKEFKTIPFFNGSIKSITDITWSPNGEYLLSTSLDQSTRFYNQRNSEWFEFGRPQIHGFDMISVKSITSTRFVSAGDEKVIRIFDMPKNFFEMVNRVCDRKIDINKLEEVKLPETASLPVLGLSNKAELDNKNEEEGQKNDEENTGGSNGDSTEDNILGLIDNLKEPPTEDILQRHTLWPEIEKLYGHGFEITTLEVSNDCKFIASACRSNNAKHSVVRIFNTKTWLECNKLSGHELTITRLKFNNLKYSEEEYLLSVSRDRKFCVWKRECDEFKLIEIKEKAHNRIIWDCTWVNFKDNYSFITCSRDKEIKLWKIEKDEKIECKNSIKFKIGVTSIDSILIKDNKFKVIVGLDNGDIFSYILDIENHEFEEIEKINEHQTPGNTVSRISICPNNGGFSETGEITVAIGSKDSSLRIMTL